MKIRDDKHTTPQDIDSLFARAMQRAKHRTRQLINGPALAGAMMLGGTTLSACDLGMENVGDAEQSDWVQYEGVRNIDMVQYIGAFWAECGNPNTRFGCSSVDVFLKLRVKPVANANLDYKEVGVVYRNPFEDAEHTAYGYYYTTWDNGYEEWHVRVTVPTWRDFFTFDAFYRDGAYHTFFDDNQGELHAINAGPDDQIIRVNTWANTVVVDEQGVHGKVVVRLADLDYDKKIRMVATADDWDSVLEFGMGVPGEVNTWHWVEDVYGGELWEIDLDIPGAYSEFQYAVQYQHGVVNDATTYGFWANNGGYNYHVERVTVD